MQVYDVDVVSREYEAGGDVYEIDIEVITYQLSRGTFSSRATDPEEYYGTFKTEYEILDILYYKGDDDGDYIHEVDLPQQIIDELDHEFTE